MKRSSGQAVSSIENSSVYRGGAHIVERSQLRGHKACIKFATIFNNLWLQQFYVLYAHHKAKGRTICSYVKLIKSSCLPPGTECQTFVRFMLINLVGSATSCTLFGYNDQARDIAKNCVATRRVGLTDSVGELVSNDPHSDTTTSNWHFLRATSLTNPGVTPDTVLSYGVQLVIIVS